MFIRVPYLEPFHPIHILCVCIPDVSYDLSVSPTVTGRSEGLKGGCQPGSRASEAVESCSGSIRQD